MGDTKVKLVKDLRYSQNVPVLTGSVSNRKTLYSADMKALCKCTEEKTRDREFLLTYAKYLTVGQSVGLTAVFSNAVVMACTVFMRQLQNIHNMEQQPWKYIAEDTHWDSLSSIGKHLFKSLHEQ